MEQTQEQNPVLKFNFTLEEANVIIKVLQEVALPHKVTNPLIQKMVQQAQEQTQPTPSQPKVEEPSRSFGQETLTAVE